MRQITDRKEPAMTPTRYAKERLDEAVVDVADAAEVAAGLPANDAKEADAYNELCRLASRLLVRMDEYDQARRKAEVVA